jgi:hypothetical protein
MLRVLRLTQFVGFCGLFVAAAAAPAGAQPRGLGVFGLWGAFQDQARCYAIAKTANSSIPRSEGYASVAYWPRQGLRGQLHFRLSAEKREASAILLRIDGQTFQLIGRGADAWAPDARADAQLVAAMRTGLNMTVETRSVRGGLIRDHYRLRGAPSAIDAAAVACARR